MTSNQYGPLPPYDLIAERSLLGALFLEREAIIPVAAVLKSCDFYLEKHALVYEAALACYRRRVPSDLTTVADELRRRGVLEVVGGLSFLGELAAEVPTAVHVGYYASVIERTAVGRRLIEAGGKVAALGFDDTCPIEERLDKAAQMIYQLSAQRQIGQDFATLSQIATEYLEAVQVIPDDEELLGVTTGYANLDGITKGMKPGELIILAARPAVGKTAFGLNIAYEVARLGYRVAIFSMEMDRELLLQRLVAMEIGCETTQVPRLLRRGHEVAIAAMAALSELPIEIDHSPALNIQAIRDRARRLTAEKQVDLWIVDYLQLARGPSDRDDEVKRITAVSQGLMTLAREFRVPVLALSQLSRAVEGRQSHVPMLADLRGSGSIEQDASQVWFIYRDELYDPETDKGGIAEIHVAKHRNGELGVAPLRFVKSNTRFLPLKKA